MIITDEFYIDIIQVKKYNAKHMALKSRAMLFCNGYDLRQKGWVVDVQAKNGVSTRQRLCNNKAEAIAFVQLNYTKELE